ncbi:MAG: V-type ATPase subunit, partial [Synergistaceae bacterium]|nr:V-type ATPase subunit [Synergistaceae bacterium]
MSRGKGYGYAVARIRAMESLLLDAEIFRRMLDAADLAGALKVLGETVYGRSLADSGAGERCDAALEAELLSTYLELRSFVPKKELVDLCRLQYDFHNVKVLIKSAVCSKSGGKKRWDLLTDLGTIPGDTLIASVESEEYRFLPYGLSALIPDCFALWEKTGDMVEVERIADGALFAQMLKTAADLGEPGALKWVKARVDSENIRNLLRLKRFGFEPQSALAFL